MFEFPLVFLCSFKGVIGFSSLETVIKEMKTTHGLFKGVVRFYFGI